MAHVSLYRKYRPASFDEVVGQEHVTRTLTGAIATGRVNHAYLFAGSRGTGKTSTAKLLAKALNCAQGPTVTPCGECESCRAVSAGTSLDVIEMDAASNRGIDDIREIRDRVAFATVEGKYRVYILDEAHMLTKEASNAFLKVLEEPPAHVIFVLCTTEAHKVIPTIQSRCQKFEFRRPDAAMVQEVLGRIARAEDIEIEEAGLTAIARGSSGAFRDAIGVLDQLATYCDKKISLSDVLSMLGAVESELLFEAVDIAAADDARGALLLVDRLAGRGRDLAQFTQDLIGHLRNIFLLQQLGGDPGGVINAPAEDLERLQGQARTMSPARVTAFIDLLFDAYTRMRQGGDPRLMLELAFIRATRPRVDTSTRSLLDRIQRLEERLDAGGAGQAAEGISRAAAPPPIETGTPGAAAAAPPDADVSEIPREAPASGREPHGSGDSAAADTDGAAAATAGAQEPDVAAGDEPQPPEAAPLSLDRIAPAWSIILSRVKKRKIPLYSVLKDSRPLELEGRKLTIGFPPQSHFHKTQVEKPENRAVLAGVLKEMTGADIAIRCQVAEAAAGAAPLPPPDEEDVPSTGDVIAMMKEEFEAEEI